MYAALQTCALPMLAPVPRHQASAPQAVAPLQVLATRVVLKLCSHLQASPRQEADNSAQGVMESVRQD